MLRIDRILCPTDYSSGAEYAFRFAAHWAVEFNAELHVLHVKESPVYAPDLPPGHLGAMPVMPPLPSPGSLPQPSEQRQHIPAEDVPFVEVEEEHLAASEGILDYAETHAMDLIVMGTHGRRGTRRLLMGSVAEEVVRRATCPVCTVRAPVDAERDLRFTNVLVPVDFSASSAQAVRTAKEWAHVTGAQLFLLHVMEENQLPGIYQLETTYLNTPEARTRVEQEMAEWMEAQEGPAVPYRVFARYGYPARTIVGFARERGMDLILMGTHGRTGFSRMMLGSVAEKVMRTAECPVLVLRSTPEASEEASDTPAEAHTDAVP